jgi:hypothetical protein
MMEDIVSDGGKLLSCTYYSLDEFADAAERRYPLGGNSYLHFPELPSLDQVVTMAREGWDAELAEALTVAESAIDKVRKLHEVDNFTPVWDVSGCEVDVARYLSGEPENMIDFPITRTPKQGRVITLCASVAASAGVKSSSLIRRGHTLAAFAMILTQLGYASELWIDMTVNAKRHGSNKRVSVKVLVKGCNDTIDPSRIVFAFAHAGVLRRLMFAVENGMPETFWNAVLKGNRGVPAPCIKSLPEGTIYLPELLSGHDVPDAHEGLKNLLRETGLLAE